MRRRRRRPAWTADASPGPLCDAPSHRWDRHMRRPAERRPKREECFDQRSRAFIVRIPRWAGRAPATTHAWWPRSPCRAGVRRTRTADARHAPVMPLPRHGTVIEDVAERAGIGLDDIEVQIDDDDDLLGSGLCGYTNPPGTIIILYPDAFSSVEELVKTLGHERMHVYQARVFGPPSDSADGARRERAAVDSEEMWWQSYRGEL